MIKFECKLTSETTKQVNKFTFRRVWWVMLLLSLFFFVFGLIGYFGAEDNSDEALGIFMMVFGALFAPLVWLLTMVLQKCLNKTAKYITDSTDEVYEFDEEKVRIRQTSVNFETDSTYKYAYFYKVFETKTHYFLYIAKQQCHVVPKNSITEGTLEELNDIFKRQLYGRFKYKK